MKNEIYVVKPSITETDKDQLDDIIVSGKAVQFVGAVKRVTDCPIIVITDGIRSFAARVTKVVDSTRPQKPNTKTEKSRVDVTFTDYVELPADALPPIKWSSSNVRYVDDNDFIITAATLVLKQINK